MKAASQNAAAITDLQSKENIRSGLMLGNIFISDQKNYHDSYSIVITIKPSVLLIQLSRNIKYKNIKMYFM